MAIDDDDDKMWSKWRLPLLVDVVLLRVEAATANCCCNGSDAIGIKGHSSAPFYIDGHKSDAINIDKDLVGDEKDIENNVDFWCKREGKKKKHLQKLFYL